MAKNSETFSEHISVGLGEPIILVIPRETRRSSFMPICENYYYYYDYITRYKKLNNNIS